MSELLNTSLHKQTPSMSSCKGSDTVMVSEVTLQNMKWNVDPILWDFITTLTQNARAHRGIRNETGDISPYMHKQSSSDSCIAWLLCFALFLLHFPFHIPLTDATRHMQGKSTALLIQQNPKKIVIEFGDLIKKITSRVTLRKQHSINLEMLVSVQPDQTHYSND